MAILQTDQIEVLEPPSGQMNVELCLVAEVPEPFHRDAAVFDVVPNDNLTTADLFSDYFSADLLTPTYITVPAGVSGEMSFCLNFTIFSDNVRNEGDEIIRLDLQELSESYDLAIFASTAAFLSITIVENNGSKSNSSFLHKTEMWAGHSYSHAKILRNYPARATVAIHHGLCNANGVIFHSHSVHSQLALVNHSLYIYASSYYCNALFYYFCSSNSTSSAAG